MTLLLILSHLGWYSWGEALEWAPGHSRWERKAAWPGGLWRANTQVWMGFCFGRLWARPAPSSSKYQDEQGRLCWGWGRGERASLTA